MKHQILHTVEGSGDSGRDALETLAPSTTECSDQPSVSRRAVVNFILSSAALAATAVPAIAAAAPLAVLHEEEPDPAIRAIERQAAVWAEFMAAYDEAERLEELAVSLGATRRPFALVAWRCYSHIGGTEIEKARDEFLAAGIAPELVEREYDEVRRNYLGILDDQRIWDASAGIPAELRKRVCFLRDEGWRLRDEMARTPPTTMVGAAALAAEAAKAFDEGSEDDWQFVAMRTIAAAGGASIPVASASKTSAADPDAELLDLAQQWRGAMEEWNNCGWEPIDDHPAGERASQLEDRMDKIEALTLHGLAVKILALTSFGDFSIESNSAIRDAMRLTGFTRWTDRHSEKFDAQVIGRKSIEAIVSRLPPEELEKAVRQLTALEQLAASRTDA